MSNNERNSSPSGRQQRVVAILLHRRNRALLTLIGRVNASCPSFDKKWLAERIAEALSESGEVFVHVVHGRRVLVDRQAAAAFFLGVLRGLRA